jgi:hypothetical protein
MSYNFYDIDYGYYKQSIGPRGAEKVLVHGCFGVVAKSLEEAQAAVTRQHHEEVIFGTISTKPVHIMLVEIKP